MGTWEFCDKRPWEKNDKPNQEQQTKGKKEKNV
jgi:hypothetical protein